METEAEINAKIMKLTMVIQDNYPELSKYINEMPITIPTEKYPEINHKILQEYLDSLLELLRKYAPNHSYFL